MTPDEAFDHFDRMADQIIPKVIKVVGVVGVAMETKAKANASGRPGPRVQTDTLRGGLNTQLDVSNPLRPRAVLGNATEYAEFVEKGTSRADPYPHMLPAVLDSLDLLEDGLNTLFD